MRKRGVTDFGLTMVDAWSAGNFGFPQDEGRRLVRALTSVSQRRVTSALGVIVVVAAPITLINPERIYGDLIRPSLVALWLSQLIVFAVYPRFAARHRQRMLPAWSLTVIAVALTLYGLWTTVLQAAS